MYVLMWVLIVLYVIVYATFELQSITLIPLKLWLCSWLLHFGYRPWRRYETVIQWQCNLVT